MKMDDSFFSKSREIANDYIQSVVFLDDRTYNKNTNYQTDVHDLDPDYLSSVFAKEQKVCAFYNPRNEKDINCFKEISKKADIIILDWYIDFISDSNSEDENEEEDEPDIDVRGKYTKDVISSILDIGKESSLKLVLIYTGETDLEDIVKQIAELNDGLQEIEGNCELLLNNIKILVRAKSNADDEESRFKHLVDLQDKVVRYDSLPSFILDEFTKMTLGILWGEGMSLN